MELPPLEARPLVSVLVTNHDYERFLPEALESAARQTYSDLQIVVCDDGSTDRSVEILRAWLARDGRIELVEKKRGGVASALNAAFERARGEVVALLDADDVFAPAKVERVVAALRATPGCGLCAHPVAPVTEARAPLGRPVPRTMPSGWIAEAAERAGGYCRMPPASGLAFRRAVAERLFPIPDRVRGMADGYLARCAALLTEVAAVREPLAEYRQHGGGLSAGFTVEGIRRAAQGYAAVFEEQRRVLGPDAHRLRLDELVPLWENVLAHRVLAGGPGGDGVPQVSTAEALRRIPRGRRRAAWRTLLRLPGGAARAALRFWWSPHPLKRLAWAILGGARRS